MSYLSEIDEYKYRLLYKLAGNKTIQKLIDAKLTDPEAWDELCGKNIFPFLYSPGIDAEKSTFVCFDLKVPYTNDDLYKNTELHFYVFSHRDIIYQNGHSKVDLIMSEIDKMINGSTMKGKGYGLDTVHLRYTDFLYVNTEYTGKQMVYQFEDFNQCCRYINEQS